MHAVARAGAQLGVEHHREVARLVGAAVVPGVELDRDGVADAQHAEPAAGGAGGQLARGIVVEQEGDAVGAAGVDAAEVELVVEREVLREVDPHARHRGADLVVGRAGELDLGGADRAGAAVHQEGGRHVDHRQLALPALGPQGRGLHRTERRLQDPVPAAPGRAGGVVGGGHVGAGQVGPGLQEIAAGPVRGHAAAVEQDVGIGRQRLADGREARFPRRIAQGLGGGPRVPEPHRAGRAVGEDVHRIDRSRRARAEGVGDAGQPVVAGIEHHHLDLAIEPGEQVLHALDPHVDEGDLVARHRTGVVQGGGDRQVDRQVELREACARRIGMRVRRRGVDRHRVGQPERRPHGLRIVQGLDGGRHRGRIEHHPGLQRQKVGARRAATGRFGRLHGAAERSGQMDARRA